MARCPNGQLKVINMLGQEVCMSDQVASGYYLYSNEAIDQLTAEGNNPCGPLRPGFMHIRGAGTLNTCAGRILTVDLPDIHLVNSRMRPWMLIALGLSVLTIGFFTVREFLKWRKR